MAATADSTSQSTSQYIPRVVIANISRGQVSTHMMMGVIQSLQSGVVTGGVVMVESGPYLDSGRNKAIANALPLTSSWDWLLFIDSDIEFTPKHISQLFAPYTADGLDPISYPVMGGIYANPFGDDGVPGEEEGADRIGPVAYEWVERDDMLGEKAGVPTFTFRRLSRKSLAALPPAYPTSEDICEVACVGTGFMAIHISLIDRMALTYAQPLPWFEEPVRDGIHYGEDMGFCLRVRDMGYPVLVNRACTPLHHKTIKLI